MGGRFLAAQYPITGVIALEDTNVDRLGCHSVRYRKLMALLKMVPRERMLSTATRITKEQTTPRHAPCLWLPAIFVVFAKMNETLQSVLSPRVGPPPPLRLLPLAPFGPRVPCASHVPDAPPIR